MKAIELLTHLKTLTTEADDFYKSCPTSVKDFILDNEYYSAQGRMLDKFIHFEFGKSCEIVFSWLYDEDDELFNCSPGEILHKLDEDWKKQNVLCDRGAA